MGKAKQSKPKTNTKRKKSRDFAHWLRAALVAAREALRGRETRRPSADRSPALGRAYSAPLPAAAVNGRVPGSGLPPHFLPSPRTPARSKETPRRKRAPRLPDPSYPLLVPRRAVSTRPHYPAGPTSGRRALTGPGSSSVHVSPPWWRGRPCVAR